MRRTFPNLEIAVTGPAGAGIAQRAGVDRVELCSALELGGVTPSQGSTEATLTATGGSLAVHALIRPRPGDFCYAEDELGTAEREISCLARQGIAGVVIGALNPDGTVALEATRRLVGAARAADPGLQITFHRAVDQTADPVAAVEPLARLGVDRILSSGQANRAIDGVATLRRMVQAAAGIVEIMAGGGVQVSDIQTLVTDAGVQAVHSSAKAPRAGSGRTDVSLGSADGADPGAYFVTDQNLVQQAAEVIRKIRNS